MKIDILCVGKLKEKYLKEGVLEYSKRLSRFCQLNIIESSDEKTDDIKTETERKAVLAKEGERIRKHLSPDAYVIALVIEGERLSSEELAERIEKLTVYGKAHIQFIIGGSLGIEEDIIKNADMRLSFSPMTFPHQLMRMILLEQIYRSFKIINGQTYHK